MKTPIRQLSFDDVMARLRAAPHQNRGGYAAMYSSWYGGIIRDPQLMMVPVDDHVVHRGDGVFEATKCLGKKVYALDRHLDRLMRSAELIALRPPHSRDEIKEICLETTRAAEIDDCILRLYVTRGPGGFTANPYESIGSQLYLVITPFKAVPEEKYERGVSAKTSDHRVKESFFATVKSCNYLQNVLMKKEAVDAGVDFTVSRDEEENLAEGSTENFAIITREGDFVVPGFSRTLKGVTAVRAMELAEELVRSGAIRAIKNGHVRVEDVAKAKEAMMLGTTLDVLPVTTFDGNKVGDGKVGPVVRALLGLMRADLKSGPLVIDLSR